MPILGQGYDAERMQKMGQAVQPRMGQMPQPGQAAQAIQLKTPQVQTQRMGQPVQPRQAYQGINKLQLPARPQVPQPRRQAALPIAQRQGGILPMQFPQITTPQSGLAGLFSQMQNRRRMSDYNPFAGDVMPAYGWDSKGYERTGSPPPGLIGIGGPIGIAYNSGQSNLMPMQPGQNAFITNR